MPTGREEIAFVVKNGGEIVPIEVETDGCVGGKSLAVYNEKFAPAVRFRLSANDMHKNGALISCPLHLSDWLFSQPNWAVLL